MATDLCAARRVGRGRECSLLNKLASAMRNRFPRLIRQCRVMTVPNNYKDYARYAEHCLKIVTAITDQELRRIQREMAAEWLRLADAIRHPRGLKQMQIE